MAKQPTTAQCEKAIKLRVEQNKAWPEVLEKSELNYSQAWLAVYHFLAVRNKDLVPANQRTATKVAQMRRNGLSWGEIMVRIALYRGANRQKEGTQIDGNMSRGEIIAAVQKGIDEKMARLVSSGRLTEAQAQKRGAKQKARAEKVVDQQLRAGGTKKAAPAKKASGVVKSAKKAAPAKRTQKPEQPKPSKRQVAMAQKKARGVQAQADAEARTAAREAAAASV
jgi:hypothetical protein